MLNPAIWKETFDHLSPQEALTFVAGLRHAASRRNYCGMHCHPAIEIVYHPTGSGVTHLAQRRVAFGEGSAVVYAPGEWHDQAMSVDGEDLCIQIAPPDGRSVELREGFLISCLNRPWIVEEIQQLCLNQHQSGSLGQRIFNLRATAILLALIDLATAASQEESLPPAERHVLQAERFISEHFSTLGSLQEVAKHVGLSHDHLRHLFKEVRGQSLIRHLNEVKVKRAKLLLTSSPLLLKQIAAMCGFQDEYYFSAVFRRHTNLSPGAYRQRAAAETISKG